MTGMLRREWPALTAFAAAFALAAWAWPRMPDVLPVHWGPGGEPDRFGGRFEALLLLPLIMLGTYLLLLVVERYSTADRANRPVLAASRFGLAVFAVLYTAAYALDWSMVRAIMVGVGIMFATLGNVLGKAQPSPWVGIRTPWTFNSRRAWHRSQRRGGVMLLALGALVVLAAVLVPDALLFPWLAPLGLLGALAVVFAWLTYASWRDWRSDPNPEPVLPHGRTDRET